jgi:anti-sigma factor RsiW
MAFLDDELAPEERRELELHLLDCASCRTHVDGERADIELIRARLATPPAPDLLRARIGHALDAEDKQSATTERKRWSRWLLPGSAVAAAAAALFVFVGLKPATEGTATPVAIEVARQGNRSMPLEVQGPGTGPWLQQHFASTAAPPQFREPGIDTLGARLTAVYGHDAAIVKYRVTQRSGAQFDIIEVMVRDLRPDELSAGQEMRVGNRTVHLIDANGIPGITYVGPEGMGYAFFSSQLDHDDLLSIIMTSDLIERSPPVD